MQCDTEKVEEKYGENVSAPLSPSLLYIYTRRLGRWRGQTGDARRGVAVVVSGDGCRSVVQRQTPSPGFINPTHS